MHEHEVRLKSVAVKGENMRKVGSQVRALYVHVSIDKIV